MKIRIFEIEATPDELDSSATLNEILVRLTEDSTTQPSDTHIVPVEDVEADEAAAAQASVEAAETPAPSTPDAIPGVAAEGQATVRGLLEKNAAAEEFMEFLAEAMTWTNVRVHGIKPKGHVSGTPLDYSRYLRLRKQGSQFGGFAYAYPINGYVHLRLNFDSGEELKALAPDAGLTPQGHKEYGVEIWIKDDSTLKQALELARMAYDRT